MSEDKIIIDNTKLIHFIIKRMNLIYKTNDEYQTYYDDGLIGLINGAKTYKEDKEVKLSTYLATCIKNEISRGMYLRGMNKRKANFNTISLNGTPYEDNEDELIDFIADKKVNIEEEVEKNIQLNAIKTAISKLKNKKDAEAITMYYGLDGNDPMTYEKIAKVFGVTREMIWVRVNRALKKLKETVDERSEIMNDKPTIFKEEQQVIVLNPIMEIKNTMLEQLQKLKRLNTSDYDNAKMEIAKTMAMSKVSQVILQSIALERK